MKDGGGDAIVIRCDVTDANACETAVELTLARFGAADILVNVAGGSGPIGKTGAETLPEEFRDIVDVNMTGSFNMIRAVAPAMMARRYGKIVNVGGTFGMRGRAGRLGYSASKWGLRGVTKSFALELGPHNINVNYVAPGMVDGDRFRNRVCRDMAAGSGSARRRRRRATRPTTRSRASRQTPTSPMPACFSQATSRGRSPASTCRWTAAGRRSERGP